MKTTKTKGLNFWTYIGAYAVALALIIWSYTETGFYKNYVEGFPGVFFIVYVFPYICISIFTLHILNANGVVKFTKLRGFLSRIFNRKKG